MKKTFNLSFVLAILVMAGPASAKLVVPLRANPGDVAAACVQGCRELKSSTREFDNGNTFVRFEENVANEDVEILLPERMTSNDVMEALIKIRTAQTNAAARVDVSTTAASISDVKVIDKQNQVMDIDLETLLVSAGAKRIRFASSKAYVNLKAKRLKGSSRATSKSVVFGTLHPELTKSMASEMNLSVLSTIPVATSSAPKPLAGNRVFLIAPPTDPHNESFLRGLSEAQQLARLGAKVQYVSTYLPYARSDKIDQGGITVTGRLIADMIESSGVSSVAFMRAHAPQSQGFFRVPTIQSSGRPTVNEFLSHYAIDVVVSPDAGFQKDATLYADDLGVPVSVINKQRDPLTSKSKIIGVSGPDLTGKTVVIIDDETASGSTLGQAAEFLKTSAGAAKVIAVVTHLTGNASKAIESSFIDVMAVTDTLPAVSTNPKLKVLSTARELSRDLKLFRGGTCNEAVAK